MARTPGLKSIPLSKVRSILERNRKGTWDTYASVRDLELIPGDSLGESPERYKLKFRADDKDRVVRMTETSLAQLCTLAGVPKNFMERIPPALGIRLLRTMLETRTGEDDRHLLLRGRGSRNPRLRAILPNSYVRLNDTDILEEVERATSGSGLSAARVGVDEDYFFLRLMFPDALNLGTAQSRDPGLAGIDLIASETGCRPLEVRNVLLRVVCVNGITEVAAAQRGLRTRYTRMDRLMFQSTLVTTLDRAVERGRSFAGSLAETRGEYIESPQEEINRVFREFGLGSPRGRLARWVIGEVMKDLCLFGVQRFDIVQAFTAVARDLEHKDRIRFEDAMGNYLLHGVSDN